MPCPSPREDILVPLDADANWEPPARIASELREMTGLSATTLGRALGVSREQYSRWMSGHAISVVRRGQLTFLHTLARDLVRRLGEETAPLWWSTPGIDGTTPADRLETRRYDIIRDWITSLPDPEPIVAGKIVALVRPLEMDEEALTESDPEPHTVHRYSITPPWVNSEVMV